MQLTRPTSLDRPESFSIPYSTSEAARTIADALRDRARVVHVQRCMISTLDVLMFALLPLQRLDWKVIARKHGDLYRALAGV